MFTCPTCNADRSRILPVDPCPECGELLVAPDSGFDPNLSMIPTMVSNKKLPQNDSDESKDSEAKKGKNESKSHARTKLPSLPPPPVVPPKPGTAKPVKATAKPKASKEASSDSDSKDEVGNEIDAAMTIAMPPLPKESLPEPSPKSSDKSSGKSSDKEEELDESESEATDIRSDLQEEDIETSDEDIETSEEEYFEDEDELALDELQTEILSPAPSAEVLAAKPSDESPFDSDMLSGDAASAPSPFDESIDIDEEVLTKTVADISVDIALPMGARRPPKESESTPEVLTKTIAEAEPVRTPTPSPEKLDPKPLPVSVVSKDISQEGPPSNISGSPSSVLAGVLTPPPPDFGPEVAPQAAILESAGLPKPPPKSVAPTPFVAPKSWNAVPVTADPDAMARIPDAYALPGVVPIDTPPSPVAVPSAASVPTPHPVSSGVIPQAPPVSVVAQGQGPQPTPAPLGGFPQTIGPPPELTPSHFGEPPEGASPQQNPANPNQVWRQAHPSAQKWAERRHQVAPRTPKPAMIALGLILIGLGGYLLSIFLPSKVPLSAAEKLALASQAGVDENAWRFNEQLMLAANLNAGLFIFLGLVVVIRGALFRQAPNAAGKKKSGKTSILLVFCFVLLALSFGALLFTGSTS